MVCSLSNETNENMDIGTMAQAEFQHVAAQARDRSLHFLILITLIKKIKIAFGIL